MASSARRRKAGSRPRSLPVVGQVVQALLGDLDLVGGAGLESALVGLVDHVLADRDQLAAQVEVVDRCGRIRRR